MALEIAPAPAKATPAKPSAKATSGSTDSTDRAAKPSGHEKSGQATDPPGFLALLVGLGQEPPTDVSVDSAVLVSDASDSNTKDVGTHLAFAQLAAPLVTSTTNTTTLPGSALSGLRRQQGHADAETGASIQPLSLEIADKAIAGRQRRGSPLADTSGPMGTQQLQAETPKEPLTKLAEQKAAREGKVTMSVAQPQAPAIPIPASLQAPIAGEEARKAAHVGQAKVEVAENLVVLSSGLSGALSAGGVADVGPSGSAAQFQSVVAQEVAYYVSQDVQSAEMKLEGVGGGPVEVSINMQGKEAQVVFRTDEIQTRHMLEGATTQLKDMLQQQGVVLTGVFVGSSGTGDSGQPQDRKFRQGQRSETTLRIATPEVRNAVASAAGVGRTLDLYV